MTIPRITSLLIMLALGRDVLALQLGQISAQSLRGQSLAARITLYGMAPAQNSALAVEVMAEFGAPQDALAVLGVNAQIVTDESGATYIAITSRAAIDDAQLALRVRLKEGSHAVVRRYALMFANAPAARAAWTISRSLPATISPAVATAASGNYGPVRAGQSLWRILQETGLAHGETGPLMNNIVAANPRAFVSADPSRLRVGAMLQLPDVASTAEAAPASGAVTAPSATGKTDQAIGDAELAARLERLATQFAVIRARYAEHKQPPAATPDLSVRPVALKPGEHAASLVAQRARATPSLNNETTSTARQQGLSLSMLSGYVDGETLMLMGGGGLAIVLVALGARLGHRRRGRRTDAGVRSADRNLVAEITRKTEKRIQLESEVKRRIADRRDAAEDSMSVGLRPADLLAAARMSLEDIETRIAHGQYNDAEAMLEQVIAAAPNNHRAKLRLAEIYYLNERHEEFVELSAAIHRQHRSDIGDENWARLMRMGKVIAPDRPPFSGPIAVETGRRVG